MVKEIGDFAYYISLFGNLKSCTIVQVIRHLKIEWTTNGAMPYHEYDYIVRFRNGKTKLVKGSKIL